MRATILAKHKLRVTDIASPLYKTDWPGAPLSKQSERRDQFHADFDFRQQDKLLDHCIGLANTFGTDRIRCFRFLAARRSEALSRRHQREAARAADRCAKSRHHSAARKRDGMQHRDGRRSGRRARRRSRTRTSCSTGIRATPPQSASSPIRRATICCRKIASATATARTSCEGGRQRLRLGARRRRRSGLDRSAQGACSATTIRYA